MSAANKPSPTEILLVEDNLGTVRLIKEALKEGQSDHQLQVANNGEHAMALLRREGDYAEAPKPDLIVLDLNVPKKDGREVLEEIKADHRLRKVPIVVLTTSRDLNDVNAAYDLNCNCYITKPVDLDQFIEAVQLIEKFWLQIVTLPSEP